MSLINEALKKVQNQHGDGPTAPPGHPAAPHPPHSGQPDKGKHRSFVWGFVVAVLVVGLVTSLLATFFVWQILGTDEPVNTPEPAIVDKSTPETPVQLESAEPAPLKVQSTPEPAVAAPKPERTENLAASELREPELPLPAPASEAAPPEPVSTPPAQTIEQQEASLPVATSIAEESVTPAEPDSRPAQNVASPPDPAVIERLQEIQIRGVMSGGIKVLIQDQSTGRTRAYRVGDDLEGTMGLVVASISSSTIQFRDYAGSITTKSF